MFPTGYESSPSAGDAVCAFNGTGYTLDWTMVKVPQSSLSILMPIDRPDESDATVQSGSMSIPVPGANFTHSPSYNADTQASSLPCSPSTQGPTIASSSITATSNTHSTQGNATTVSPAVAATSYIFLSAETKCLPITTSISSHVASNIRPSVLASDNDTNSSSCQSCIPAAKGGSRSTKTDPTSDGTALILGISFLLALMWS
jgi:hypothetical protein